MAPLHNAGGQCNGHCHDLAVQLLAGSTHHKWFWPPVQTLARYSGYDRSSHFIVALSLALAGTLLGGIFAVIASAFAGAFMAIYTCVGLAIIHHVTRGKPYRSLILTGTYLTLLYINSFGFVILAMLGLSERISPLKRNFDQNPPPRDPNSST